MPLRPVLLLLSLRVAFSGTPAAWSLDSLAQYRRTRAGEWHGSGFLYKSTGERIAAVESLEVVEPLRSDGRNEASLEVDKLVMYRDRINGTLLNSHAGKHVVPLRYKHKMSLSLDRTRAFLLTALSDANLSDAICQTRFFGRKFSDAVCRTRFVGRKFSDAICRTQFVARDLSDAICQTQFVRRDLSDAICQSRFVSRDLSDAICPRDSQDRFAQRCDCVAHTHYIYIYAMCVFPHPSHARVLTSDSSDAKCFYAQVLARGSSCVCLRRVQTASTWRVGAHTARANASAPLDARSTFVSGKQSTPHKPPPHPTHMAYSPLYPRLYFLYDMIPPAEISPGLFFWRLQRVPPAEEEVWSSG